MSRTITINILNFNYLEEDNFINNYLYHNKKTKKILCDLCEIIFIELPKFNIAHKDYFEEQYGRWIRIDNFYSNGEMIKHCDIYRKSLL